MFEDKDLQPGVECAERSVQAGGRFYSSRPNLVEDRGRPENKPEGALRQKG